MALVAMEGEASAATRVGVPNIEGYCESKYANSSTGAMSVTRATLKYHSADGWRCYKVTGRPVPSRGWPHMNWEDLMYDDEYGVDMNDVCRQQYGWRVWAAAGNASNPYSWACYV
jgi:hypothetical protein